MLTNNNHNTRFAVAFNFAYAIFKSITLVVVAVVVVLKIW